MLLLIGSDGNSPESPVAKRFGHANYFITYNTDAKTFEALENIEEEHDHKNLEGFINQGVEVFIAGNVGPHAFEIMNTPKTKIYLARNMAVRDAIEKFTAGELRQLTEPTMNKSMGHDHDHNGGEHLAHHNHN